ncbi:uncharacterized protein A4U43_C03F27570 [Asparagus officinalis]|uniref:Uncharacterized protein n=1 Tax=Asparagus officinalis TaxID=4686 RepID=A0A5P1FDE4_ASPOF|nr:uncharacterized protein A4U43_C03F27570 [Asparagus officinalis]
MPLARAQPTHYDIRSVMSPRYLRPPRAVAAVGLGWGRWSSCPAAAMVSPPSPTITTGSASPSPRITRPPTPCFDVCHAELASAPPTPDQPPLRHAASSCRDSLSPPSCLLDDRQPYIRPPLPSLRGNLVLSTNLIHLSLSLCDYSGVLLLFSGLRPRGLTPDLIGDLEQRALMGSKEIKQSLFRNAGYWGEMLVKRISELGVD